MPDVFISYKREERPRCLEIFERLAALKLDVWFDARLDPGTRFDDEIETAVRSAKVVLVLWSPEAARSEWIRNEATIGKARKVLSSAFIQPTELPIAFLSTQTEDLSLEHFPDDWPGWLNTLRRIGSLVGRPGLEAYARLLARPDAEGFKRWAERWPDDALAALAWQRAEGLELDATRSRLAREREGRTTAAAGTPPAAAPPAASDVVAAAPKRPWAWPLFALGGGAAVVIWLLAQRGAPGPPENNPTNQPGAHIIAPAASTADVMPAAAAASKPTHALAAARQALDTITPREWGVLNGDTLTSRVTTVAPFEAIKTLAAQGDARAQVLLAIATQSGFNGVELDPAEALRLYRLAAARGQAMAQAQLGWNYATGTGGLTRDDVEAVRLLKAATAQGNAIGQVNLAVMVAAGRGGLVKNEAEAVRLRRLSAEQGSPVAQRDLGASYESGFGGLPKDERQAQQLYRLAADQGDAVAQAYLGVFYRDARGGLLQDDKEAVRLFRLSVAQGDAYGQANLGYMHAVGRGGLTKDPTQAYRLYALAARQGHQWAQEELRRIGESW